MFLDADYLLSTPEARRIFNAIADLPIVDAHNHADVAALAANRPFDNLWTALGATDHYVWEVMRKAGVAEADITGGAPPQRKFAELARVAPLFAGNPVYEWLHLDLRFLGIELLLNAANADAIWRRGESVLARPENLPQAIIARSNIEAMASTDDPADELEAHRRVNAAFGRDVVRPTWRPDRAMKIGRAGWREWIARLGERFQRPVATLDELLTALAASHAYFAGHGCRASDHGLEVMPAGGGDDALAARIFACALAGGATAPEEACEFQAFLMRHFAEWDAAAGWVTQLHLGPVRDVRDSLRTGPGPDSGGDISSLNQDHLPGLLPLLNRLDGRGKCVLYCLEPAQQPTLATVSRAFGATVALGSAWWFNDTPVGMRRQLEYVGSVDLLSCHAGMVSDSRKLTSYQSRFTMFRRVLADVLGGFCRMGRVPEEVAVEVAANLAYRRAKNFFGM